MSVRKKMSDATPPVLVIAVAVIYGWTALKYDAATRMMPLAVAGLVILLCAVELLSQQSTKFGLILRGSLSGQAAKAVVGLDGQAGLRHNIWRELSAFAWIIGFLGLALLIGFYGAIPIYVFIYLRFHAKKSVRISATVAAVLVGFLYLTFQLLLGYRIFEGLLMGSFI